MTAEQHRALALLPANPEGLPESLVYAHKVPVEVLVGAGQCLGRPVIEVTHVEITDAGREAISALQS